MASSETLISEAKLFKLIESRLISYQLTHDDSIDESEGKNTKTVEEIGQELEHRFLKSLLQHVRLPLMSSKLLVTSIKFCGHFEDAAIFEAL